MVQETLSIRANNACELCNASAGLCVYEVPPVTASANSDRCILVCENCSEQLQGKLPFEEAHWQCLKDSMWSETPVVQVVAWRVLKKLSEHSWAQDLLDMLYLDDELLSWAKEAVLIENVEETRDSNGSLLVAGDSVTLIKDLQVKGAGFTAKRGTMVKNISVPGDGKHVEGKVNGTRIVLIAEYLKKA